MKKTYLCLAASLFLAVISCGDDDSDGAGLLSVDTNPTEETVLDPSTISENISIKGGERITGEAPQPTGTLAFTLDNTTQSAFLNNGFDITFDAPDSYAGAYIQIKSNDGTAVADYFDVEGYYNKSTARKIRKSSKLATKSKKVVDNEVTVDVDFNDNVPPGKFCYIICIYDDAGNISQPVEVCVEVEAWGGNPNLIGTWNYTKTVSNGIEEAIDSEDCEDTSLSCENGTELNIENAYCYTTVSLPIIFNEDGTYSYISTSKSIDFDYDASFTSCTAIFQEEQDDVYTSAGNWAFDEEEGKLTLVEFEYTETDGDEVYEGIEEDGYLLFDGNATISSSELIIEDSYDDYEDGLITEEYYFTKN
ncbi:hypothetical protein GCM10022393_33140 [Aquimarina addita]|uniref:Lipocalin-like domain-containing protein n=1 Tax=Aquimarina addita TaxID=870485 RepID=A0ABP6UP97_9FLAO